MIAIGSDHGGYKLKEEIKKYLDEKDIEYKDFGTYSEESVDYPEIAKAVAKSIQSKETEKGILICRSGIGKYSRMHNNSNLLALGADYISTNEAICIVRMYLATEYEGGRHDARLKMIEQIENENMK